MQNEQRNVETIIIKYSRWLVWESESVAETLSLSALFTISAIIQSKSEDSYWSTMFYLGFLLIIIYHSYEFMSIFYRIENTRDSSKMATESDNKQGFKLLIEQTAEFLLPRSIDGWIENGLAELNSSSSAWGTTTTKVNTYASVWQPCFRFLVYFW